MMQNRITLFGLLDVRTT